MMKRSNSLRRFYDNSTTLCNRHLVEARLRRRTTSFRFLTCLLSLFDIFECGFGCGLSQLWTLVTLGFDDIEGGTFDGLRSLRDLSTVAAAGGLLLDTLLVQTPVQLGP